MRRQQNTTWTVYLPKSVSVLISLYFDHLSVKTLLFGCFGEHQLTHESAKGDDGQQTLDQHPEPVGQSSVIAAVRIRLIDLRHVGDFKNITVQKPFHQEEPSVQIHDDTLKTTAVVTKGGKYFSFL